MLANVTFAEWVLGVSFAVSTLAFVVTLYRWRVEIAEKREDRRQLDLSRKEAADLKTEMREIQRRGRAPDLRPSALHVPKFSEAPNQIVHPGESVAASTPAGIGLQLDLANLGERVRHANDDWQLGEGIRSSDIRDDPHRAVAIGYVFDPAQLGKPRQIRISFETLDGLKLHHVYETRHGFCEFRRIDPAI